MAVFTTLGGGENLLKHKGFLSLIIQKRGVDDENEISFIITCNWCSVYCCL